MKIICVGRNYIEHIEELKNKKPENIIFFFKPDTCFTKDKDDFYVPDFSSNVQYECELVVKIDKVGKSIPVSFAKDYYSMVTLGIDYTLRDIQQKAKENSLPWTLAKGFDYSAPIGEFLSLQEFNKNIQEIDFCLKKNNVTVQQTNTSHMLHSVNEIIAYISQFITLKTGDLLFTGTPAGVGKVSIGDILTGYLQGNKVFEQKIK